MASPRTVFLGDSHLARLRRKLGAFPGYRVLVPAVVAACTAVA